jgi:serine/threonine protein kinase
MNYFKHSGQVVQFWKISHLGSFGRVKLAKNKTTNKYVALKQLKKAEIIRLKQVDHVINENTILGNLQNPFIVNFEGFC